MDTYCRVVLAATPWLMLNEYLAHVSPTHLTVFNEHHMWDKNVNWYLGMLQMLISLVLV